jgi:hypothetical protein
MTFRPDEKIGAAVKDHGYATSEQNPPSPSAAVLLDEALF